MNLLTVLEGAPALIADITLLVDTAQKILPEAIDAEHAIVEAVVAPAQKLKADIHAMFVGGAGLVAIVQDVQGFVADAGALATALESLIPLVEAKAASIWQDVYAPAKKLQGDLQGVAVSR